MPHPDVDDGVHMDAHAHVDCHLVEGETGVVLVGVGQPRWSMVNEALVHVTGAARPSEEEAAGGA